MGTNKIGVCHTCKKYIDLDKSAVLLWLTGNVIHFGDEPNPNYELYYAFRLLRFIFIHQDKKCNVDLIHDYDLEDEHYFRVIKNYEEHDFETDMKDTPWEQIWERSQENISYLNVQCKINSEDD